MSQPNNKIPISESNSIAEQFNAYLELVKLLRRECPWDSAQTNQSIAPLMIEETYEVLEAIRQGDDAAFAKELGDILLHVVLHSVMAEERGAFNLSDVLQKSTEKLIHRHPNVFAPDSDRASKNWEELKMEEGQKSTLDGVPKAMPALLRAERIQHKAARVGFEWAGENDAWDKIHEELGELREELDRDDHEKSVDEFGDFVFALVNLARMKGITAEEAVSRTNDKFTKRFQFIEKKAKELDKPLKNMTLEEMIAFWSEAKKQEHKK